jgi:pilus assembly protein CpaF
MRTTEASADPRPTGLESPVTQRMSQLKRELHNRLLESIDVSALRTMDERELRTAFRSGAEELCRRRPDLLSPAERRRVVDELVDETLGLGPLEPLLRDPSISDILINGPKQIFVEKNGALTQSSSSFYSDQHLLQVIQRIVAKVGRRVDESSPMVDARLPDGSRVNAIVRPIALDGALVSIRRFSQSAQSTAFLLESGAVSPPILSFLRAAVLARLNILISGGTGSGKTTLLNALSSFIPHNQRIVTIEDAAELQLQQPHLARMETRPPNLEGSGAITTRDLLRNALRMRPDRIIVGECRGSEAIDMLQAMNTGHDGGMTTIHSNSAADALSRLQLLVGLGAQDIPHWFVDQQIASGIQLVVHTARLNGGARRVVQVSEMAGLRDGRLWTRDIFAYESTGVDDHGSTVGSFKSTGVVPQSVEKLRRSGVPVDDKWFVADAACHIGSTPL